MSCSHIASPDLNTISHAVMTTSPPYFAAFLKRKAPARPPLSAAARTSWQLLASATIGLGLWYLHWRWTHSLNPDALVFSILVASAETAAYLGTLMFFFDIWDEGDTPKQAPPRTRCEAALDIIDDADNLQEELGSTPASDNTPPAVSITVDVFITTYDEDIVVVEPSVVAARALTVPEGVRVKVWVLDDGNRVAMSQMAERHGCGYLARADNRGFKAGNLANALFETDGDFILICDADTQVFPGFLENTLGYFRDSNVSWVQTPHWFYDIPEGTLWVNWIGQRLTGLHRIGLGWLARGLTALVAPLLQLITGSARVGADPFLSEPVIFFDIIQRRRNRHNASFCCGAGSIHRREAVFDSCLIEQGRTLARIEQKIGRDCAHILLPQIDMQPFRYHVSEDIFTSIQQQSNGWKSVFHPDVEARMLSPWSMKAWATQKLKYAGGTFDILLHANPIWRRGMPWQTKLHYMATFWSYLSLIWVLVLLLAPAVSLIFGIAPVDSYSLQFFLHILPVLFMNELAMSLGCKGYNIHTGRILSLGTLSIQARAMVQAVQGRKPLFPPTPKTPMVAQSLKYAVPNLILLAIMLGAALWGVVAMKLGSRDHTLSLVMVNLFWLGWNSIAVLRVVSASFWRPPLTETASAVDPPASPPPEPPSSAPPSTLPASS